MATPWDRAAAGYIQEWVPRFVPYHLDLVNELALNLGDRVFVPSAGPGSEVLAAARAVGESGRVRATDKSKEMVRYCCEHAKMAGFNNYVSCEESDATDANGGPWEAILCAFGLWQFSDRTAVLRSWRDAIVPNGKIAVMTWGPPELNGPFESLRNAMRDLEPDRIPPQASVMADRDSMSAMFEEAELVMVRHTVVRHTLSFKTAEAFVEAMTQGYTWREAADDLGERRLHRVAARFYESTGGPDVPLTFAPPATIAIAGLPGAELDLAVRSSMRVPAAPPSSRATKIP